MKILLICLLAYPIIAIIVCSVMTLYTLFEFKVLKIQDEKFGCKGAIQFWWLIAALIPLYALAWIFQKPLNYQAKKKERKIEEKKLERFNSFLNDIQNMNVGDGLNNNYTYDIYVIREKTHYTFGVFHEGSQILSVFQDVNLITLLVKLSLKMKDPDYQFSDYTKKVYTLEEKDRNERTK